NFPVASDWAWPSPQLNKFGPERRERDTDRRRKCAMSGSHWSFSAGEHNLSLRDDSAGFT
ncbi:hypothetical protein, partial [Pseudomonas ogarae]|uniref:hypothetical protein n=1 Tax=Pseudomonas ogarae (strain DSM 112162 / CECT 30235 / F113) TaxID=1114970 RepID=UPI00194F29C6